MRPPFHYRHAQHSVYQAQSAASVNAHPIAGLVRVLHPQEQVPRCVPRLYSVGEIVEDQIALAGTVDQHGMRVPAAVQYSCQQQLAWVDTCFDEIPFFQQSEIFAVAAQGRRQCPELAGFVLPLVRDFAGRAIHPVVDFLDQAQFLTA